MVNMQSMFSIFRMWAYSVYAKYAVDSDCVNDKLHVKYLVYVEYSVRWKDSFGAHVVFVECGMCVRMEYLV